MPETAVYLVRHGTHDWLRPGSDRLAGTLPGVGLNEAGRAEGRCLASRLATVPLQWIVSSPLQRTVETAHLLAAGRNLEVATDDRLIEWRCGPWEGMRIEEIRSAFPEQWRLWHESPAQLRLEGAESLDQVADRMEAAFHAWAARGGAGVIVSHQDPLAALLCRVLGVPLDRLRALEIPTGSLSECRVMAWGPVVTSINVGGPLG